MARPVILVVDDDQDFSASLGDLIREKGCDVAFAFNCGDALALYDRHAFDLVFLDRKMPGMGGIECFFELRKQYPDAQVVMISGYYNGRELLKAKNNGLCGVLDKPVDIDRLNRILEKVKSSPVILVVDDASICPDAVSRMLAEQGYRVCKAKNSRQAVEKFKQGNIRLMILDRCTPVMNGCEVCGELQKAGCMPPTIITTAYTDIKLMRAETRAACLFSECMIKPIKSAQLYKAVDNALHAC